MAVVTVTNPLKRRKTHDEFLTFHTTRFAPIQRYHPQFGRVLNIFYFSEKVER